MDLREQFLTESLERFRYHKGLGDGALAQLKEAHLHWTPGPESNSISVIVKHLSGNMRSRWTDFLTSDGEKPDRNRDTEFIEDAADRAAVLERWETGWTCLLETMRRLTPEDLDRTITIRSEPLSVIGAIQRQLSHVSYHVGQIVLLARWQCGERWQSLSIPRGQSDAFNQTMRSRFPQR